jgi:hypothetical protein
MSQTPCFVFPIAQAKEIPLAEATTGTILTFPNRQGIGVWLAWLLRLVKEHNWSRREWHMAPMISPTMYLDFQMPRSRYAKLSDSITKEPDIRAWKLTDCTIDPNRLDDYIADHYDKPYDIYVYILTILSALCRPKIDIPRLIDRKYMCWEGTFDFISDVIGSEFEDDYNYPFITDFLRAVGDLK